MFRARVDKRGTLLSLFSRVAQEPSVPADTVKRLRGVQKVLQHKFELESKGHARAKRPASLAHVCSLLSSLEA